MNVKIVRCDDWSALYVNDILFYEDHKIEPEDICRAINEFDASRLFSYDSFEINGELNNLEEDGYPKNFSMLKLD